MAGSGSFPGLGFQSSAHSGCTNPFLCPGLQLLSATLFSFSQFDLKLLQKVPLVTVPVSHPAPTARGQAPTSRYVPQWGSLARWELSRSQGVCHLGI